MQASLTAWFVCRTATLVADVCLPLRRAAPESDIVNQGSARASRVFKREHGLHPCRRVEVEFMGVVEGDELREACR